MDYITIRQAAEKWEITVRTVQLHIKNERIPGVIRPGYEWLIPKDAEKPADRRRKRLSMEIGTAFITEE